MELYNQIIPGTAQSAGARVRTDEFKKINDIPKDLITPLVDIMKKEGVDITNNPMNQATPEMLDGADIVIVMEEKEHLPDFITQNPKVRYWDIPDPKGQSMGFYEDITNKLKKLVSALAEELK